MNDRPVSAPRCLLVGTIVPLLLAVTIASLGVNEELFIAVQAASHVVPPSIFAAFWESATYLGDGLAAIVIAALFLLWRADVAAATFVAVIPLVGLFTQGIRAVVHVARPASVLGEHAITVLGPTLHYGSFPSGHSATAAALAGIVFCVTRTPAARVLAIVLAIVVCTSRIAVGAHWPTDITTGFAGGWLCAWIGWRIAGERAWTQRIAVRVGFAMIFTGCSIALVFHVMGLNDAAPLRYTLAVIGVIASVAALVRALGEHRGGGVPPAREGALL